MDGASSIPAESARAVHRRCDVLLDFPRPCGPQGWPNVVLHATSRDVTYEEHEGPLSIKWVIRGEEIHEVGGIDYAVRRDRFLVLNHGRRYASRTAPAQTVEVFCVFFRPGFVEGVLGEIEANESDRLEGESTPRPIEFVERLYPHDGIVSPVLAEMWRSIDRGSVTEGSIDERLHLLADRLIHLHGREKREMRRVAAARPATREEVYRRVHRGRDFLESNLGERIDLEAIARAACLSPYHFLRSFKDCFGRTPHQYLTMRRLEKAADLLTRTDRSITEICFEVGFQSPGSFSSLFRRHSGSSPREFRSSSRQANS